MLSKRTGWPLGLLLLLTNASVNAQSPWPLEVEFQLNDYTTNHQNQPSVARLPDGSFLVAWSGNGSDDNQGVFVLRYDSRGYAQGSSQRANSTISFDQSHPDLATASDGTFLVVWQGETFDPLGSGSNMGDPLRFDIFARKLDSTGTPLSTEFIVNTYTQLHQQHPRVTESNSGFVVVWDSLGSDGSDDSSYSTQGRRLATDGSPLNAQFQLNQWTLGNQIHPAITSFQDGNLIATWQSFGSSGSDSISYSIQARYFSSIGLPLGDDFQVNEYTTGVQDKPTIAASEDGSILLSWSTSAIESTDIHGRLYDSLGGPISSEFALNTTTTWIQGHPQAAALRNGSFVVVWDSEVSPDDSSYWSIRGRSIDTMGEPLGGEFQVNAYTTGSQSFPQISKLEQGDFLVVWESAWSTGSDDSGRSGQLRVFRDSSTLFVDGFEDGDTLSWSSSQE